jgi:HAD superfamily hydrolase (TIGR01549 family)
MKLDKYETIILDCDGVIFDSNNLKLDAFRDALNNFDKNLVEDFIEYFRNNFGTSRYHLVKVFIEEFLKQDFDEKLYQDILIKYSQNCVVLYEKSDMTKEFLKFIEIYKNKKLFVASGSDQEELRTVFKNRDIDKYFISIFGSPRKKFDIITDIVSSNKNGVMIGDAMSDMLAAKESSIDFIFMSDYSTSDEMKQDKSLKTIKNLGDLI